MGGHRAGAGDDLVDGPVDLAAVRADDALIDAIAGGSVLTGGGGFGRPGQDDDELAAVLAAWRADIESDPMPELVTLDEALEAVDAGHEARQRVVHRSRRRMPFAVAAAAIVVAFAGLTVAVHGAVPGDTLWGVSQVAFPSRAESVAKAKQAEVTIDQANEKIRQGDIVGAQQLLDQVQGQIAAVPQDSRPPLEQQRQDAVRRIDPNAPTAPAPSSEGASGSEPGSSEEQPAGSTPAPAAPGSGSSSSSATVAPTPSPETPQPAESAPGGVPADPQSATTTTTTTNGISSSPSSTTG